LIVKSTKIYFNIVNSEYDKSKILE